MAHNPIFGPDPAKPDSSASHSPASRSSEGGSDLAELAAKVAVHGGGRVSPELSADLALQIVLNQIVEQACLATGAGGAAIALERGGEWVCQASAGRIAPQLGARLDAEAGLSGACVKTRTMQRCDDAQNDPRADTEACRMLGVRSVIILPLLRGGELAGVFEVFSSLPSAFGERDEHTLEALSQRVLRNLERAAEPIPAAAKDPAIEQPPLMENPIAASGPISDGTFTAAATADDRGQGWVDRLPMQPAGESASSRGMNILTLVLGAAVLAYAVLLTVLVIQRLAGGKTPTRAHGTGAVSAPVGGADSRLVAGSGVPGAAASSVFPGGQSAGSSGAVPATSATGTGSAGTAHVGSTPPPAGSLLVYENGREVFRVSPAAGESAVQSTGIVAVSPEMAEGSLLHRVEPDYPEEARREQIEGPVVLDVRTGRDGSVEEVRLLAGRKVLADAAIAAVKQWRFRPKVVNGKPAEIQTRVTLNFRLPH
jgi:TonB family protein